MGKYFCVQIDVGLLPPDVAVSTVLHLALVFNFRLLNPESRAKSTKLIRTIIFHCDIPLDL